MVFDRARLRDRVLNRSPLRSTAAAVVFALLLAAGAVPGVNTCGVSVAGTTREESLLARSMRQGPRERSRSSRAARADDFTAFADAILSSAPLNGAALGVLFVSLSNGATVYSRNPGQPLSPASLAKLAVSGAALENLKPEFRFKTSLLIKKEERGKPVLSALVWRGTGDPSISGRGRSDLSEIFGIWGASLTARGIRQIDRLVLDNRYFEGPVTVASWPQDELSYWYAAETSAISFNDNCVDIEFRPAPKTGRRANVFLKPDFGYIKVRNRTATAAPGSPFTLDYRRKPETNTVRFFGAIGAADAVHSDYVSVHQPALFAAHTLEHVWRAGGPRIRRKPVFWEKSRLKEDGLTELLAWESPPLSNLLKVVNTNSQNFYAEQMLKTLGKETEGHGSFGAGLAVVDRFLSQAGLVRETDYRLADGSGLSADDRFSASGLIKILAHMRSSPLWRIYYDSLAVPGVDRSARNRMKGEPLAARMRLKRGTVVDARNLAGYLESRSGRLYAFAVLVNGTKLDRQAVDDAVDRLCIGAVRKLP